MFKSGALPCDFFWEIVAKTVNVFEKEEDFC